METKAHFFLNEALQQKKLAKDWTTADLNHKQPQNKMKDKKPTY